MLEFNNIVNPYNACISVTPEPLEIAIGQSVKSTKFNCLLLGGHKYYINTQSILVESCTAKISKVKKGNLTISSGIIDIGCIGKAGIRNSGVLNINGGKFTDTNNVKGYGIWTIGGISNINGGTFDLVNKSGIAIYNDSDGSFIKIDGEKLESYCNITLDKDSTPNMEIIGGTCDDNLRITTNFFTQPYIVSKGCDWQKSSTTKISGESILIFDGGNLSCSNGALVSGCKEIRADNCTISGAKFISTSKAIINGCEINTNDVPIEAICADINDTSIISKGYGIYRKRC